MKAAQITKSIEQAGSFLQSEGEDIVIFNSNRLPLYLKNELLRANCFPFLILVKIQTSIRLSLPVITEVNTKHLLYLVHKKHLKCVMVFRRSL